MQIHLNLLFISLDIPEFISLDIPEFSGDIKQNIWNLQVFSKVKNPWQAKENLTSGSEGDNAHFHRQTI